MVLRRGNIRGYTVGVSYYVIGDDGQKYGPADVATLQDWIADKRVGPNTVLEDEASGLRVAASTLNELRFDVPAPTAYPRTGDYGSSNPVGVPYIASDGKDASLQPALIGFGLAAVSLVLTFTIGYLGIFAALYGVSYAWRARETHPALGWAGVALNVIAIIVAILVRTKTV